MAKRNNVPWDFAKRQIVERFGDATGQLFIKFLMEKCGSMNIYIPAYYARDEMRRYVVTHLNEDGSNVPQIAKHLKVSVRAVKDMMNEKVIMGDERKMRRDEGPAIWSR